MSSSINYGNCPHCHGEGTLYMELDCRTGEDEQFCMECGYQYSLQFKRDETGDIIFNDVEYDVAYCVLGVAENWQKKLSEIPGGYLDIISNWIGFYFTKKTEYEERLESLFGERVPDGYRNVYYVGGDEPEALQLLNRYIDLSRCTNDILVIKKAEYEETVVPGYGVINVATTKGGCTMNSVAEGMTREEIIEEVNRIKEMNPDKVRGVFATWYNPETKTLEVLSEIPEDKTDSENTESLENTLPF